ncbi:MAG TPA: ATP-binding protein [Bryobacteraceae bacterium]|jgi:signal transduction histidine kinase|nr:ATP-binding protein [Bryobacteraceae bacterium]
MNPNGDAASERVLVHAPFGRDGSLIQEVLDKRGIDACVCRTMPELRSNIREGAGAVIIGEEALRAKVIDSLAEDLRNQPSWSDLPLLIMTSAGEETQGGLRPNLLELLGNVSLLERPLRKATLISSVRAALRARQRQYQIRDYIHQREQDEQVIRESEASLRRANSELEEFAYVASHDIQEPLRMINSYTQLLLRRHLSKDNVQAQEYGDIVRTGVHRMERLIQDLLSYSQIIQSGQITSGVADLNGSLAEALAVMEQGIEESRAIIHHDYLPKVQGDEQQLSHVFQNLLSNALKYRRPEEPLVVRITSERRADEWVIAVEDNGIGFDNEYADKIFGLFKRLHRDEYPGTGLGLAICKRIVQRYRGTMWADSTPGVGSRFFFALPAAQG